MRASFRARSLKQRGQRASFATRWSFTAVVGILVYTAYRLIAPWLAGHFDVMAQLRYPIAISYAPAAVLLAGAFFAQKRWCYPDMRFIGDVTIRGVLPWVVAISVIYLISYGTAFAIGQPREGIMVYLYACRTPAQNAVLVACLLTLPPLVEELAFRHFLLSVFPYKSNRVVAHIGVLGTAVFFAFEHHGYQYLTTHITVFAVGVVLALARIRSDGMALPIALHAYAIGFALACDQWVAHGQG